MTTAFRCRLNATWYEGIKSSYFGLGVGGVVAVFVFGISHSREDVEDWMWVVVGDLPPAHITCEDAPNPACALDGYIGAMREWAETAIRGDSVDNLIPVNVPPSLEWGESLLSRLDFLDEHILSHYEDDLRE